MSKCVYIYIYIYMYIAVLSARDNGRPHRWDSPPPPTAIGPAPRGGSTWAKIYIYIYIY